MVNWWLEKGVAGFRIDAIINIKRTPRSRIIPRTGADGLVSCHQMVEEVDGCRGASGGTEEGNL